MFFIKQNKDLIIVLLLFGIIFSLISLVNHYNFRTNAGDLGIYNQAIYDYAHLRFNHNTLWFGETPERMLTGHFAGLQLLLSPLYWIFNTYSLLIIQIVAILLGGLGVYKYIHEVSKNQKLSLLALVHFFSIWGIYSALGFDYHDNVIASMLVPWIFYFLKKEKYKLTLLFFFLLIVSRENMALWAGFIAIGLLFVNFKSVKKRAFLIKMIVFSFGMFWLIMNVIIPGLAIQNDTVYIHFNFPPLGANFTEAIINIVIHPWDTGVAFFTNFTDNANLDGFKNDFFLTLLLSGGFALLRKPQYLIMLLPIFGQKLFHGTPTHWSLFFHYSIEFAPILTIALFEWFSAYQVKKVIFFAVAAVIACFTINIVKIESNKVWWLNNNTIRFYAKEHYVTPYNVEEIYTALEKIPKKAKVSAESNIAPHLAMRKTIYQYPSVFDAEYIVLCPGNKVYYPLSRKNYVLNLEKLIKSYRWTNLILNKNVVLFKKNMKTLPSELNIEIEEEVIKNNPEWMVVMKKQSIENEQSLDETIRINAIFSINKREETLY